MRGSCLTSRLLLPAALLFGSCLTSCQHQPSDRVQGYIEGEFVYVASPLPGALQKLHVQRGAEVKAGDPLFELEATMEKAARDQARAALVFPRRNSSGRKKCTGVAFPRRRNSIGPAPRVIRMSNG